MSVVSIVGLLPPARYDAMPWTRAKVQEAEAVDGAWTEIDDIALVVDVDPAHPATRNLTTTHATLDQGWYRVVFTDVLGNVSVPTDAIRHSAIASDLPPTPEEVRDMSPTLKSLYPVGDPDAERVLRGVVYTAIATVQGLTGRLIDPTLSVPEDIAPGAVVPSGLVPIALRAVTLTAEEMGVTSDVEITTQAAQGRRLRSISAGPWSESYFAPGEFARRGVAERPPMSANPQLDTALWLLATDDAQALWIALATGVQVPAGVASAFDYRRQGGSYFGTRGYLGLGAGPGPDGF